MRIIAGEYGGRPIEAPPGSSTRPTTDRMRESLMSRIASARGGFDGAIVLDAFAGSGALGLEALSRGAERCAFCERDRRALGCLRTTIGRFGVDERARVFGGDVFKSRDIGDFGPYDLVFLDPPYALDAERIEGMLHRWLEAGALSPDALISWESSRDEAEERKLALQRLGCEELSVKTFASSATTLGRLAS